MSKVELQPPPSAASPDATSERILDIAERLLAEHGVTGTSVRMITDKANVNVAAVNYHFGTKEQLVRAVIARRLSGIEAARTEAFDALDARTAREGRVATVVEIVEALIAPIMAQALEQHSGWPYFIRFISRLAWEPGAEALAPPESSLRMFERIDRALEQALPHLAGDPARRLWRMTFLRGATQHTLMLITALRAERIPSNVPIANLLAGTDIETTKRELIAFLAGGLSAH